jgi:hypothetical protein
MCLDDVETILLHLAMQRHCPRFAFMSRFRRKTESLAQAIPFARKSCPGLRRPVLKLNAWIDSVQFIAVFLSKTKNSRHS